MRLARIADQLVDLRWAEESRVNHDDGLASTPVQALLGDARATPVDLYVYLLEREFNEGPHRFLSAGRQQEGVGFGMLEHPPHAVDIVAGGAPVSDRKST